MQLLAAVVWRGGLSASDVKPTPLSTQDGSRGIWVGAEAFCASVAPDGGTCRERFRRGALGTRSRLGASSSAVRLMPRQVRQWCSRTSAKHVTARSLRPLITHEGRRSTLVLLDLSAEEVGGFGAGISVCGLATFLMVVLFWEGPQKVGSAGGFRLKTWRNPWKFEQSWIWSLGGTRIVLAKLAQAISSRTRVDSA